MLKSMHESSSSMTDNVVREVLTRHLEMEQDTGSLMKGRKKDAH